MDDEHPLTPLTDKALARFRALTNGNGLDPEKIVLTASDEKIYTFEGTTTLTPFCETKEASYGGPPRGKGVKMFQNVPALRAEAKKRQDNFKGRPDWIEAVHDELRKMPAEGWGLDGARIELPDRSATLVTTETCTKCQGRKKITCGKCNGRGYETCHRCQGQRQEFCYACNYNGTGSGSIPKVPGQICVICSDLRYTPCQVCRATGQTACPLCQTRGGTPCPACKGVGQTTTEILVTCGATTHFAFKSEGLPSGLRRGLDRLGIVNLSKGHADIAFIEDKKPEKPEKDEYLPGGLVGVAPGASAGMQAPEDTYDDPGFGAHPDASKVPDPVLHYMARMPFADLRIDFGGKKAVVGVFGLRNVYLDVPAFLDDLLNPYLEKLKEAIKGRGSVDAALEARALHEGVELNLQGKGIVKEFRKLYPIGISNEVIENILRSTRRSIKCLTLRTRIIGAVAGSAVSAGIFAGCFFSSLSQHMPPIPRWGEQVFDFSPLILAEILGWVILNFAAYFDLHKHFPNAKKIGFLQKTGMIGYVTLVVIALIWAATLMFSPVHPSWMPLLVHR